MFKRLGVVALLLSGIAGAALAQDDYHGRRHYYQQNDRHWDRHENRHERREWKERQREERRARRWQRHDRQWREHERWERRFDRRPFYYRYRR
jgi:hypothetical protein